MSISRDHMERSFKAIIEGKTEDPYKEKANYYMSTRESRDVDLYSGEMASEEFR